MLAPLFRLSSVFIGFFALWLTGIALSYFSFDLQYNFLASKQHMLANPVWMASFYLHLLFGAIAVLCGFPLFFPSLIKPSSRIHKKIGKIYVASILGMTGPTGFYLAFYAEGGAVATIGFSLMSLAWMLPTYLAYSAIIKGDTEKHFKWIWRSYAMTLSGVTLRLLTPFLSGQLLLDPDLVFKLTAYLSWMLNLCVAELLFPLAKQRFIQFIPLQKQLS